MTDELGRLESALRATSPRPPEPARERAMAAAMAEFDRRRQGMPGGARHKGKVPNRGTSWIRRLAMPKSRPTLAIATVAGFALLAGLVIYLTSVAPPHFYTAMPAGVSPLGADPGTPRPGEGWRFRIGGSSEEISELARAAMESEGWRSRSGGVSSSEADPGTAAFLAREMSGAVSGVEARRSTRMRRPDDSLVSATSIENVPAPSASFSRADGETFPADYYRVQGREQGRDQFADFDSNPIKVTAEEPVSTFSIDVDTASYGFVRASLNNGVLPQKDAVRVEELINYFPYDYPGPQSRETPFAASVSILPAPWNPAVRLMHIGIKGYVLDKGTAPRANLVFLVDVSGSMDEPNKLPLVVSSLKLLLDTLAPEDTVAIVVYAGAVGTALPPTPVAERGRILAALEQLTAGGSTAGAEGIRQAYLLAERHFVEGGINRVILATDGDFNVGITDSEELEGFIARKRESGVFLSVLGFGMGNYNDALMQRLAQNGNGNAAYIDSLNEARKALVDEATSMLFPIAKDVKVQVEFNPAVVSEYRLIGYETRMLAREDFRNDRVDAGEIGAGHTVTAVYEVVLAGSGAERIAPLRYRRGKTAGIETGLGEYSKAMLEATEAKRLVISEEWKEAMEAMNEAGSEAMGERRTHFRENAEDTLPPFLVAEMLELATLKIRFKLPGADTSTPITRVVTFADAFASVDAAPRETRFAAAVAGFGQLLRGGRHTGAYGYDDVIALAQGARGDDPFGYRAEFVNLVRLAKSAAAMEPLDR